MEHSFLGNLPTNLNVESTRPSQKMAPSFTLLADDQTVDPNLSSLFAVKLPSVKPTLERSYDDAKATTNEFDDEDEDGDDEDLSSIDEDLEDADQSNDSEASASSTELRRDRKRKRNEDDLEERFLSRVAREEAKDIERLKEQSAAKRKKVDKGESGSDVEEEDVVMSPPPRHETEIAADEELAKANRTVFLGNVSTAAITSKSSRKVLLTHLGSFFSEIPAQKDGMAKPKVESIRFRSTAYSTAIPKKAAFAKQELMDATTRSTNAYAVYSSQALAREAAKRLNGTVVLDRHLRVDEVAHPAKVDNRRCVFVGNLGFVDDESNIQAANEAEGRETRKRGKEPADVEEGLWRTFGKCGMVESVRVIRDSTTRVGKGIAYVQFTDENAVEAALLLNEKKFPPMLPRKLRISRAKAPKRNPKPGSGRPSTSAKPASSGYKRKITAEEASQRGRSGKLFGRAGAAQMRKTDSKSMPNRPPRPSLGEGIRRPEDFVFEGHRASSKQGTSGLKLGGKGGKGGKTGNKKARNVTKRSASFKAKRKAST